MNEMDSKGAKPSLYIPYVTCLDPCGDGDISVSPQSVKQVASTTSQR